MCERVTIVICFVLLIVALNQLHMVDLHLEGVVAALNFGAFGAFWCILLIGKCLWNQYAIPLWHEDFSTKWESLRDLGIFARVLP